MCVRNFGLVCKFGRGLQCLFRLWDRVGWGFSPKDSAPPSAGHNNSSHKIIDNTHSRKIKGLRLKIMRVHCLGFI